MGILSLGLLIYDCKLNSSGAANQNLLGSQANRFRRQETNRAAERTALSVSANTLEKVGATRFELATSTSRT